MRELAYLSKKFHSAEYADVMSELLVNKFKPLLDEYPEEERGAVTKLLFEVIAQLWNQEETYNKEMTEYSGYTEDLKENSLQMYHTMLTEIEIAEITAVTPYLLGSFDANTMAFYDFFVDQKIVTIKPEYQDKYEVWMTTCKLGMIYPFDEICFVCEKPLSIHLNDEGQLHADGKPAVEYSDGWKLFLLNNVEVPEELVMTPTSEMSVEWYNKYDNADVRTEFLRKFGLENMLDKGTKMDSHTNYVGDEYDWWHKSEYELYNLSTLMPDNSYAPYLKMKNQTTGVIHVEPVSREARDLPAAMKSRFGGRDIQIMSIK